ncbi:MAG: HAD family hydrolase [Ruminococcaceae bacterium]|nr:HAD family hydrolase [Oscillospiraceae bacterium]
MDSIIFDLDGTLWDARENVCESWNVVLARKWPELGQLTVEQFSAQMGKMMPDIGRSLFPQLTPEQSNEVVDTCGLFENEYVAEHGGVLYEDLEAVLAELSQKYRLFVVSNCQSGYIEAFMTAHNMKKYFTDIECFGNTLLPKADNIRLVVERNGLVAPVYVGDTAMDASSAAEAGVPFIWASYGYGDVTEYAARAERPADLPGICAGM